MAYDASGKWIGIGVGDVDNPDTPRNAPNWNAIALLTGKLHDRYQWARDRGIVQQSHYDAKVAGAIEEFCVRTGLPIVRDDKRLAVANLAVRTRLGSYPPPQPIRPLYFSVEGHMSNMWDGPVADTGNTLESEGVCWHFPTGYNSSALPFDDLSGVRELARRVGQTTQDNGRPFPAGTKWGLGGFSQGAIVAFLFYTNFLLPGKPLHWRLKDLVGVLAYGNPCRETGSVAPWAVPWTLGAENTHGLDPLRRFGLPGYPKTPDNWMDVWREGDIFAQNGDDEKSEMKSAIYQAVDQGDFLSNPYSIAAKLAKTFNAPVTQVWNILLAIIDGVVFLADNPNPHYSPYSIEGGIDWMRAKLTS